MKGCRPLTDQEIKQAINSFTGRYKTRDKALFLLGLKSGFRVSEMLSLTIGDVIKNGNWIDKITVKRQNMKKKTEGRTILLHPQAKKAIQAWIKEMSKGTPLSPDTFIFKSRKDRNKPISRVQAWEVLNKAFKNAGINGSLGTHVMRKTFANKVYDLLGHDLVKTQKALGHKNINSTVSYLSFREEEIEEAILAI
jgi:integrase